MGAQQIQRCALTEQLRGISSLKRPAIPSAAASSHELRAILAPATARNRTTSASSLNWLFLYPIKPVKRAVSFYIFLIIEAEMLRFDDSRFAKVGQQDALEPRTLA
jgi:hypothetical protein